MFLVPVLGCQSQALREAKVNDVWFGDVLSLDNGKTIDLAGVQLLVENRNYRPENSEWFKTFIIGKSIKYKIISRSYWNGYSDNPLAFAYLEDGVFLNESLVKEGVAFFDHAYFPGKEDFQRFQDEAIEGKKGMWGSYPTKAYLIGSTNARLINFYRWKRVDDFHEKGRINYYFSQNNE